MKDLMNNVHPLRAIAPAVVIDNTAQVSAIIDRRGFDSVTFLIVTGTVADADITVTALLEESDDSGFSTSNAVADEDLLGTEALAGFTFADDNETRKLGYVGIKRYLRLTLTPANNTGNLPVAAIALLGHPSLSPTANPPV